MSAEFTQMAVMAIFSAAIFAFVIFWSLTIIIAIKRLRAGNSFRISHSPPARQQEACDVIETVTEDGVHYSPLS